MQEKIYLRPLCLSDVNKKYLTWVNDPSVTEYLQIGKQRLKHNDLVKYIEDAQKNGRHNFAIITKNSKLHIGNGSIYSIVPEKSKFEMGYFIGEKKFTISGSMFRIGYEISIIIHENNTLDFVITKLRIFALRCKFDLAMAKSLYFVQNLFYNTIQCISQTTLFYFSTDKRHFLNDTHDILL